MQWQSFFECAHIPICSKQRNIPDKNAEYWSKLAHPNKMTGLTREETHEKEVHRKHLMVSQKKPSYKGASTVLIPRWVSPTSSIALFMLEATPSPSLLSKQLWTGLRDPWSRAAPFDLSEGLQTKMLSPIGKEKQNKYKNNDLSTAS